MTNELAPAVRDGRDPARVARIFRDRSDEVALNETAVTEAQRKEAELMQDVAEVEKQIKTIQKISGEVPTRISTKLTSLKFQLETTKAAQVTQLRICNARRETLDRWLGEGSPTNAQLIEQDRSLSAIALRT